MPQIAVYLYYIRVYTTISSVYHKSLQGERTVEEDQALFDLHVSHQWDMPT